MRLFLFLSLVPAFLLHLPLPAAAALNSCEKALAPLFEEPCRRFGIPRVLALAIGCCARCFSFMLRSRR